MRRLKITYLLLLILCIVALYISCSPRNINQAEDIYKGVEEIEKVNQTGNVGEVEDMDIDISQQDGTENNQLNTSRNNQQNNKTTAHYQNIQYGPHERNKLDVYKGKTVTGEPTPTVIFFHGGGFVTGKNENILNGEKMEFLKDCLNAGMTVVSANYRYVQDAPFPAPMLDGARVIQFVRSKCKEWNIDEDKIALVGASAGANMSLWIALKGELAKPDSNDPIERISTLVRGVIANNGQSSNDPAFVYEHIYRGNKMHGSTLAFFGLTSYEDLKKPEIKKLAYEASAINFLTQSAPPVFLDYNGELTPTPLPEGTDMGVIIHHPKFGAVLKQQMDEIGVECHFYYKSNPTAEKEKIRFLQKIFSQ